MAATESNMAERTVEPIPRTLSAPGRLSSLLSRRLSTRSTGSWVQTAVRGLRRQSTLASSDHKRSTIGEEELQVAQQDRSGWVGGLPIELWAEIVLQAADSLQDLTILSCINRQIRALTWKSTAMKAKVLIASHARRARFSHHFFSFFSLPDAHDILLHLMHSGHLTPTSCPRAIGLSQPYYAPQDLVQALLSHGFIAEPSSVVVAATRGHVDVLDALLSRGITPVPFALTAAAAAGHSRIVDVLLSRGAQPEPLTLAAAAGAGHVEVVRRLLLHPVFRALNLDPVAAIAMRDAAKNGYVEVVSLLNEAGIGSADPTALTLAVANNRTAVVEFMVGAGRWRPTRADVVAGRGLSGHEGEMIRRAIRAARRERRVMTLRQLWRTLARK